MGIIGRESRFGVPPRSLQLVLARHTWTARDIVWRARLADITSEEPDGAFVIDLRQFHEIVPTAPTEGFPFAARDG